MAISTQQEVARADSASEEDYFQVFRLPRLLSLDTAALEKQFHKLSRRLHPDLFATTSQEQQQQATERSSLLNDAYRTLKQPVERTRYLLKLEGASIEDESEKQRAAGEAEGKPREQKVPPDLLAEVFELNMQLEELQMDRSDPDLRSQLQAASKGFEGQLMSCDTELRGFWSQWDAALTSADEAGKMRAKEAMVALLHRRNYIRNLVRDVQQALGE